MAACPVCGDPRRPSKTGLRLLAYCGARCRNRAYYLARKARAVGEGWRPCTDCGAFMQITPTMAARPRCLACRRAAPARHRGPAPRRPIDCPVCSVTFLGNRRQKFCSADCFRRARNRRGSGTKSTSRGYGVEHQRLRAELLPYAYDTPCCLCGDLMLVGQQLHLDHTEDRNDYRGFAHAECNVVEGAYRGAARLREKRLSEARRTPRRVA